MKIYYEKPKDLEKNKYDYCKLTGVNKNGEKVTVYYTYYDAQLLPVIEKEKIFWAISQISTFEEMENLKELVITPPPYPKEIVELLKTFSEAMSLMQDLDNCLVEYNKNNSEEN